MNESMQSCRVVTLAQRVGVELRLTGILMPSGLVIVQPVLDRVHCFSEAQGQERVQKGRALIRSMEFCCQHMSR